MVSKRKLNVAVIGAGHWAQMAHLPAYRRCKKEANVVAICDQNLELAKKVAEKFQIPSVSDDYSAVIDRSDIDIVDICTSAVSHYPIAFEAIKEGKSILCEKPLASTYQQAKTLWERASLAHVKTKMGFTYRYSPALRRMKELIDEGFVGDPYLFNGIVQNSQFISPETPFRWNPNPASDQIMTGSLEEYAPHLIDVGLWLMGDLAEVVGCMKNSVPTRLIRDVGQVMDINIEDSTVFLGKFESGTIATFQSSFVAVGNYPGMEVRVYGSKGAVIARMVEEFGVGETLKIATPNNVEFRNATIPARLYPRGRDRNENWVKLYFGNLIRAFLKEVVDDKEPEANLLSGVKAQEIEDAVYLLSP